MRASWFVVQTQPRAEAKAKRHLINQGFTTYLPVYRRRVRHARRSEIALRPLFPGYLFVRLDPEQQRWRSINGTVGVRQILTDGDYSTLRAGADHRRNRCARGRIWRGQASATGIQSRADGPANGRCIRRTYLDCSKKCATRTVPSC